MAGILLGFQTQVFELCRLPAMFQRFKQIIHAERVRQNLTGTGHADMLRISAQAAGDNGNAVQKALYDDVSCGLFARQMNHQISSTDQLIKIFSMAQVPHTVVGVVPGGFRFPINEQLWLPLRERPAAEPLSG